MSSASINTVYKLSLIVGFRDSRARQMADLPSRNELDCRLKRKRESQGRRERSHAPTHPSAVTSPAIAITAAHLSSSGMDHR